MLWTWGGLWGGGEKLRQHIFALLIHNQSEPFDSLRRALNELLVETCSVATCKAAKDAIARREPDVIFTPSSVADGTWMNILDMGEAADVSRSVIVVGAVPDTRLYLSVMERGAFDFVAPPFEREPMGFILRSAALNTQRRRRASAHTAAISRSLEPGKLAACNSHAEFFQ
jgi:DNA-binding NtrC family response regulator